MQVFFRCLLSGFMTLAIVTVATAETRYVSDTLVITIRELPDNTSTHIKNIVTNTPFEVLEVSGDYMKVRLEDGTEGYVKERFTTADIPNPTLIENLTTKNSKLKKQYSDLLASLNEKESTELSRQKELQTKLNELKKNLAKQTTTNAQLTTDLDKLNKKYTTLKANADNVVQIVSQSEKFRTENERLLIEFEASQSENAFLLRMAVIKWVLTGAGILFIGWIMGKTSRNKRRF